MKILMVCLGNICRSPLAEGILRQKAKKANLQWLIDSAGTAGYHIGEQPHTLSQKVSLLNGIDRDTSNYDDVKKISGENWNPNKTKLLLNELYPGENKKVPDPWYGIEDDYHTVYHLIEKACEKIIEHYGKNRET
jgi:protein-tyrosine phosphatase